MEQKRRWWKTAIIELVDWSNPVDGAASIKKRKKQKATTKQIEPPKVAPTLAKDEIKEVVKEAEVIQDVENISINEVAETATNDIVDATPQEDFEEEVKIISKSEEKPADEDNLENA